MEAGKGDRRHRRDRAARRHRLRRSGTPKPQLRCGIDVAIRRVESELQHPAQPVIDGEAHAGEMAVDLGGSDRVDAALVAHGDDRAQVVDALPAPALSLQLALFGGQEGQVATQVLQAFEIVDEGQIGGRVVIGFVRRRSLQGAHLCQPLLVHRLGDRLELLLGDIGLLLRSPVEHLQHPRRHRRERRSHVARRLAVRGPQRQPNI